jgi:hypothetical protein
VWTVDSGQWTVEINWQLTTVNCHLNSPEIDHLKVS